MTIQQSQNAVNLNCKHQEHCSVCPWLGLPLQTQRERKIQALKEKLSPLSILPEISYFLPSPTNIRDRVDLTYANGKLGFYDQAKKEVFSPTECLQMSPGLFAFFQEIQKIPFPIKKGSVRLRVFGSQKGIWLDFANEDVRQLFAEKKTLLKILDTLAFVEIGQRRKPLSFDGVEFHLSKEHRLQAWSQTWAGDQGIPLYSVIGSFSQSGSIANQVIVERLSLMLKETTAQNWLEFGCGNGNLTFPLANQKKSVVAVEFDELSLKGMEKSLELFPALREKIIMKRGDFLKRSELFSETFEGVLANPPRSGLKDFISSMDASKLPDSFVYMSCYLESFASDSAKLLDLGYKLSKLEIIDQFPHSEHFEILASFSL